MVRAETLAHDLYPTARLIPTQYFSRLRSVASGARA